ncbi:MAG: hypothetical protein Kow00121_65640 [Elainellaceae cyanobacterium]
MEGYSILVRTNNRVFAVNLTSKDEAISNIAYIYRNYGTKFSSAKVIPTHHLDLSVERQPDFRFLAA